MIEIIVENIVVAKEIIDKISKISFSGRSAFVIARLIREINREYDIFEETRTQLVNKYANKDENGELIVNDGMVKIPANKMNDYHKEVNEILKTQLTIAAEPLAFEWLENIELTPEEALALEPFIKFE